MKYVHPIVWLIPILVTTAQQPLVLSYGKSQKELIPVYSGDQDFVNVKDLIALLDAGSYENTAKRKIVIGVPGHQIKVTAANAFVVVDETTVYQMPVENEFIDGQILVPVSFFLPILNANLATPVKINGSAPTASIKKDTIAIAVDNKTPSYNLTDVGIDKKLNGLLFRIKTEREFAPADIEIWRNKSWIYVTISGGVLTKGFSEEIKKAERYKLIKEALAFQHKNSVQLSFLLTNEISGQEVSIEEKSGDIYVALRVKETGDLELDPRTGANLNAQKDQWKIDKIVLDAGHGGKDNGAKGKNGTKEKDMTLAITLKLGKLIQERLKIPVEYTRDNDTYITLAGRTKFANQKNAKLFISVHCNANKKRTANGFEIFFLSPSRNDEALAVARLENEVIDMEEDKHRYGDFTDEKFILANIMQSVFVRESEDLASKISKGIDKQIDLENRGVSQAPFYVLMGASMPSILVETAFITNPNEEKFLKSEEGQKKLAEGILEGIRLFIEEYEKANP